MLQIVVIVTWRCLWEYFCLLANLCLQWIYLPQLAIPDLCQGWFSFLMIPYWYSTIRLPSSFQTLVYFCIYAEKCNVFVSEVFFFPFQCSSLCIYILKIVYSAKLLLRATANEITILWESKTLFLMVLPDLMLHKHAVASEEKERELPTTWNHLLLRGLSCIFV